MCCVYLLTYTVQSLCISIPSYLTDGSHYNQEESMIFVSNCDKLCVNFRAVALCTIELSEFWSLSLKQLLKFILNLTGTWLDCLDKTAGSTCFETAYL